MTVALTGTGGLFTRLGQLGKFLKDSNIQQATTYPNDIASIVAQYTTNQDYAALLSQSQESIQLAAGSAGGLLQSIGQTTLLKMVNADAPRANPNDLSQALTELIRQMTAATQTVKACTVTATNAAASGNTGTGVLVLSTKRPDGLVQENLFAETATARCTADAQTGGTSSGNETFTFAGASAKTDVLRWDWPAGSGGTAGLQAVNASNDNSTGNLLTNSDFETFTSNTPSKWTVVSGTPGTHIFQTTAVNTFYTGASALRFAGSAANQSITQTFNDGTNGTAGNVLPSRVYLCNVWLRFDVVPASGTLTIDLIDSGANVINDDQGVANSFAVTLSGASTNWTAYSGAFRLPRTRPATVKLRVRASGSISAGSNLYIDRLALAEGTRLYAGGPYGAVFSGATAFVSGDYFTLTSTNDRGGATYNATFQGLFDRFFGMRSLDLLLPSAASPTLADSLFS